MSLAKNMRKSIGKNVSKNLIGNYSEKLLDHAKKSGEDVLKTGLKREIKKTAEATGNLIRNNIPDKFTKVSRT